MARKFDEFLEFCEMKKGDFNYLKLKGSFERILNNSNNNQSGHFQTLFYAIFDFLQENNTFLDVEMDTPFSIKSNEQIYLKWNEFINQKEDISINEYSYNKIRENIGEGVGGVLKTGGGWSPTLKILFPTIQKYILNKK